MAKVIALDNYGDESVSDKLIIDNLTEEEAQTKAKELNENNVDVGLWFYKAVEDSYVLYTFEP